MNDAPTQTQSLEEWRAQLDYGAEMARRLEHQESYMNEQRLKLFGMYVTSGTVFAGGACVVLIQAAASGLVSIDQRLSISIAAFAVSGLFLVISAGIGALATLLNERHLTDGKPNLKLVILSHWICYAVATLAAICLIASTTFALRQLTPLASQ